MRARHGLRGKLTGVRGDEQDVEKGGAKSPPRPLSGEGASLRFCPGLFYIVSMFIHTYLSLYSQLINVGVPGEHCTTIAFV